jgi:hypothetical protein
MKALKMNTEGVFELVDFTDETCYDMIKEGVGGYVECVHLPHLGVDMWVNEEGKLTGLPTNDQATLMWARSYGPCDVIKGNVVFTKGTGPEGETMGLDEHDVSQIMDQFVDFLAVKIVTPSGTTVIPGPEHQARWAQS